MEALGLGVFTLSAQDYGGQNDPSLPGPVSVEVVDGAVVEDQVVAEQ